MYFIEAMYEACENLNIDDSLKFKVILAQLLKTSSCVGGNWLRVDSGC